MTKRFLVAGIAGATMVLGLATTAAAARGGPASSTPQAAALERPRIRGHGGWNGRGKAKDARQRWDLDVARDKNALRGRLNLAGSPLAKEGVVTGTIDGDRVSGTVSDSNGALILNFEGVAAGGQVAGEYIDRTGERGSWSWEGSLP